MNNNSTTSSNKPPLLLTIGKTLNNNNKRFPNSLLKMLPLIQMSELVTTPSSRLPTKHKLRETWPWMMKTNQFEQTLHSYSNLFTSSILNWTVCLVVLRFPFTVYSPIRNSQ